MDDRTDLGKWVYIISGPAPGWEEGVVYRGQIVAADDRGGKKISFLADNSETDLTPSIDAQIKSEFTVMLQGKPHTFTQDELAVKYNSQDTVRPAIDLIKLNNTDTRSAAALLSSLRNPRVGGGRTKRRRRKRKSKRK